MDFTPSLGSVDREKVRIQARPTGSYKERHPLTTVYSISILQTIAESCCDKYSLWPAWLSAANWCECGKRSKQNAMRKTD